MAGKKTCSLCCQMITFTVLAILFIALGIGAIFLFEKLIKDSVNDQTPMKNGSDTLSEWKAPTSPVFMSFYVFDVQNPGDVQNGKKPILKEKGPYTYREDRVNEISEWSPDGKVVTYEETKWYYFDKERSCANCSDTDVVTTINISPMSIINKVQNSFFESVGLNLIFKLAKTKLYMKRNVHDLIFGYEDELLTYIKNAEHKYIPEWLRKLLHLESMETKIQLQYNGTASKTSTGNITISTGKGDPDSVLQTLKWRGKTSADYWKDKYAGMLNGTDGTHFHPFVKEDDVLYTFITDLCRALYLNHQTSITVRDIKLLRFTTTEKLFANASVNPDNAAFCVPRCFPSGILPIGQCIPQNPPIMMSAPHFYQCDPGLADNITGMHPVAEKHATYLDVEPYTGITMQAYKRLQINLLVLKDSHISLAENVRYMIHPVLYLQEFAQVDDKDAAKFRRMVYDKVTMTKGIQYGLIALGGLFVLILLVVAVVGYRRDSNNDGKVGLLAAD